MPVNSFENYPMSWKPNKSDLKRPIYKSMVELMEADIASGLLPPGTMLPPQRELADFLDINFTTVTRAYKECELKGLIYAITGKGTFVASSAAAGNAILTEVSVSDTYNFGFIASLSMGISSIKKQTKLVCDSSDVAQLLTYENPLGLPRHRQLAAAWLEYLKVPASPERCIIASGAQNAITLALLSLFNSGDKIAVDKYTHANFIELAKLFQIQLVPISMDTDGMEPKDLESQCKLQKIKGIYLMPSCQNPTGIMMSNSRKEELAHVINRHNLILLEDDFEALLTITASPEYAGSISSLVTGNYVYISSIGKAFGAGLRVAFLSCSANLMPALTLAVSAMNIKTSSLEAEIVCEGIRNKSVTRFARKKVDLLTQSNEIFDEIFEIEKSSGRHPVPSFRWLPINSTLPGTEYETQIRNNGIIIYHSDRFISGSANNQRYIRISLTNEENMEHLRRGLMLLKEVIN